jgi:hypothetical protein
MPPDPSLPSAIPSPPAAGEHEVERRLRSLGSACAVPAAAALVVAVTIVWMAAARGGSAGDPGRHGGLGSPGDFGGWLAAPPSSDAFLVALGAMLLVLLASAVHGRILRRQETEQLPAGDGLGETEAPPPAWQPSRSPAWIAKRLRAYSQATWAAFAMLAAAVALGAALALGGRAPFYGLVICLASLAVMGARWPRRATFDLALGPPREHDEPQETGDGARPVP